MCPEFHIFASKCERLFTVTQPGLYGSREFGSLLEAVRHLRDHTQDTGGSVIVFDGQGRRGNRIPLHVTVSSDPGI